MFSRRFISPIVLAFALALAAVGCGPRTHHHIDVPVAETKVEATAAVEDPCDGLRRDFDLAKVTEQSDAQTVEIERTHQRIIRHDCDGKVISDRIETVQSPHGEFDLKLPQPLSYQGVFVFDRESCEHKLAAMPLRNGFLLGHLYSVTGDNRGSLHVKGDLAQATFTFHVKEGRNNIVVRYYEDCVPRSVPHNQHPVLDGTCDESTQYRTRLFPVDVKYTERDLDGFQIIDKTEAECRAHDGKAPVKSED